MPKERERWKVELDVGGAIVATWPYAPLQIGAAWLLLLQLYQSGRDLEYFANPTARQRLLGLSARQWKREGPAITACYQALHENTRASVRYGRQAIPQAVRLAVYERDEGICEYCNVPVAFSDFHCDHVVPVSKGGGDDAENLVCSCPPCNLSKAARNLQDWRGRA